MQLFGSKKDTDNISDDSQQEFVAGNISGLKVAILSKRNELIDRIRAVLFLYNILGMEIIPLTLSELKEAPSWNKFDAIILDIKDEDDAEFLSENINRCIPVQLTVMLIGNCDSIQFSEYLIKRGIHFLLEDSQLEKIPAILYSRSSIQQLTSSQRVGSVVTFLGTKGGIGTSSLVVQTLKKISDLTSYPLLYIQGATTSPNADFLFETPIPQDGSLVDIEKSLKAKIETSENGWNYKNINSGRFNITVIDQNMGISSSFKHLDDIVEFSNIVFIVINRDPYSIKTAKKIIAEISRATSLTPDLLNKRFLICLNDNVPYDKKNALQNSDIEDYLERKIDFVRKFIPDTNKFKKAYSSSEINEIASAIIGNKIIKDNAQKAFFKIFKKKD